MKFSYDWIKSLSGPNTPNPNELSRMLTLKLFEVEGIEERGDDRILDIDVLPSRAGDCLSHIGMAREISAMMGSKFTEPLFEVDEDAVPTENLVSVEVSDPSDCPRYVARVITGIEVGPSPEWIKERLEACGIQSINNVVDAANYVMLETGQPLHAFDMDRISGKVIVRRAKSGERIVTLDGKDIELDERILLIADTEKPLGIAGIKGGKEAEISNTTKNIVIESASFDRKVIRKGSSLLKLRTDASVRFEHGFDPNLNEPAVDRAASLIAEIAKGKIAKGKVDIYQDKVAPRTISLDLERTEGILGIKVAKDEISGILSLLGFEVKEAGDKTLSVEVPTRRVDVSISEDLVEEIGRMIGYDKVPSKLPRMEVTPPEMNPGLIWERRAKESLRAAGLSEVYNHTFISEDQAGNIDVPAEKLFEVESPVSIEQKYLRPSLIPHLGSNVKENGKFFQSVEIFELGKTFSKDLGERRMISGAVTGESFYQVKGMIEFILEEMGIEGMECSGPADSIHLDPARSSRIIAKGIDLGMIGYASDGFCKGLRVNSDFCLFELDFDKMVSIASEGMEYVPLPKHPEMTRDLAIVVPLEITFKEVVDTINGCRIPSLKEIELFDLYRGKGIPEGTKSVALHLTFREDRTLTTEEVNGFQEAIMKAVEDRDGWQIRK